MPSVTFRTIYHDIDIANAGQPASLSGAATITGEMREGQTPVATWPTVVNGKPTANVVSYIIRWTANGGDTFTIAKQGATPQTMDTLTAVDAGRQYQLVMRVHNAVNMVDEEPQVLSALTAPVTVIVLVAPTFATGPTVTGTPANGQVMTVAFTSAGSPTITGAIRWLINTGIVVGATSTTWTGLGLAPGDQVKAQVQLTGPGGQTAWTDSNVLLVAGGAIAQTATFGTVTPAGSGGWRPQLASGAVENLASYNSLTSGSLGAYTPSISSGRLVFTGAAGAPNGAVLNCTGVSGRVYAVTITTVAARKDIATDADITVSRGVAANLGLTLAIRQNARIPAKSHTISGQDFLPGTSQTVINSALLQPITVSGEGDHVPGEYHMHSWKNNFPSGTTIEKINWADQTSESTIAVITTATRRTRALTIKNCTFSNNFNVDGPEADWSTGFTSTGYNKVRHIYLNGNNIEDIYVYDNKFSYGYTQIEGGVTRAFWELGNMHKAFYYDARKIQMITPTRAGKHAVRMSAVNYTGNVINYSVGETAATAPHADFDQVTSGQTTYVHYTDAQITYHISNIASQYLFHTDRANTASGGWMWSIQGSATVGQSPYVAANAFPENSTINRMAVVPGPQYLDELPISAVGTASNSVTLGSRSAAEGGSIGVHYVTNGFFRVAPSLQVPNGPAPGAVTITGNVYYNGYDGATLDANIFHWDQWASLPESPTHAEAWELITRPVPASAFEAVSPWGQVTIPTSGNVSDYTISETLRPTPVLTSLTITDPATCAYTVNHNIANDNLVAICAVFTANCTDPDQIRKGVRWNGSAWVDSVDRWNDHSVRGATGIVGGGVSGLAPGTYWLCIAAFNGPKKVGVASASFTVV